MRARQSLIVNNENNLSIEGWACKLHRAVGVELARASLFLEFCVAPALGTSVFVSWFILKKQKREGRRRETPGEPNDD